MKITRTILIAALVAAVPLHAKTGDTTPRRTVIIDYAFPVRVYWQSFICAAF